MAGNCRFGEESLIFLLLIFLNPYIILFFFNQFVLGFEPKSIPLATFFRIFFFVWFAWRVRLNLVDNEYMNVMSVCVLVYVLLLFWAIIIHEWVHGNFRGSIINQIIGKGYTNWFKRLNTYRKNICMYKLCNDVCNIMHTILLGLYIIIVEE